MNKSMARLERLAYFTNKQREFITRTEALRVEMQNADNEFHEFLKKEFGVEGQTHLADVLKKAIETSHEPTIIAP